MKTLFELALTTKRVLDTDSGGDSPQPSERSDSNRFTVHMRTSGSQNHKLIYTSSTYSEARSKAREHATFANDTYIKDHQDGRIASVHSYDKATDSVIDHNSGL